MLFVHTGLWSFVWRDVIDLLRTDFRCITLDAPATGLSGGTSHEHATIRGSGASVTRLVDAMGLDDFTLVFHDLGGLASLLAAAKWNHRVRRLVAVNTFGWRPSGLLFRGMIRFMGSAAMRETDALTGFLPWATSGRYGVGRHFDRSARRAFRKGVDHRGRRSFHRYMSDTRRDDLYQDTELPRSRRCGPCRSSQSSARATTTCTSNPSGRSASPGS